MQRHGDKRLLISIHAPTRGATIVGAIGVHKLFISIHAPTRGATTNAGALVDLGIFQSTLPQGERRRKSYPPRLMDIFQSTLPQGERRLLSPVLNVDNCISIHAPTRGATLCRMLRLRLWNFNPRSHKGSDS